MRDETWVEDRCDDEPDYVIEETAIDHKIKRWLTGVPASDINFKVNLARANASTIRVVIEELEVNPNNRKGALRKLHARLKQLERDGHD